MYLQVITLAAIATLAVGSYAPIHHEVHHHAKPYAFGYSVKDHHGEQHREESGDGHGVKGSYGFTDDRGVHRQVNYVADHGGFRAEVKTNEPGTANQDPAAVKIHSSAHHQIGHGVHGGYAHGHDHGHHHGHDHGHHHGHGHGHAHGHGAGYAGAGLGGHFGTNYAGHLLGGSVSGYDSRFAHLPGL